MKKVLIKIFNQAAFYNHTLIIRLLDRNSDAKYLDLGCDDGELTMRFSKKIGTKKIYGIDVVDEAIQLSMAKGISVEKVDLNGKFDFPDDTFDVITANQVIEHINNSDLFITEIRRILKPGGYAVISTENASSWCNIFASILGWRIFSLTNFSDLKWGIGNPFALHKSIAKEQAISSWHHVRIYNIRGLREYFEACNLKVEKYTGSGYFPLPAWVGNIDRTHCHFITFKVRK